MLRVEVRRLKSVAVLLLALLTAGQLALHHHSLAPESGNSSLVCGICAFNADHVGPAIPAAVPRILAEILVASDERAATTNFPHILASRGPPSA